MANIREILKEKRANEANYVYLTAYAIVVLKAFYSFSEILSHYYEQRIFTVCNIVAISILAIKLLFFQDYSIRQIFILIFLAFSTFYTDTRLGLFLFLLNFLIIAATQNVDTHWVLSVMNKIQIIVLGIHIALYPIYYFFLPDHVKFTYRNGDYTAPRHQFLLQHSNTFSMLLLWTILGYLYSNYEKLNKRKVVICWLIYYFFYQFADSNSGLMILTVVSVILLVKLIFGDLINGLITFMAKYLFIILAVFFNIMMVSYTHLTGRMREIWISIDEFFTGRLKYGAYAYDKAGFTLLGQLIPYDGKTYWQGFWIDGIARDNTYMFLSVVYGLVYTFVVAFLFWKYSSKAKFEEKLMIVAYSLYAMMEMYVTYTYFCFAIILVMQYVWEGRKSSPRRPWIRKKKYQS